MKGKTVARTGDFDYAIRMYVQGLDLGPENAEAHQALREISLKRKISGGRDMGMIETMKMPNARERTRSRRCSAPRSSSTYFPADRDRMIAFFRAAEAGGFATTAG